MHYLKKRFLLIILIVPMACFSQNLLMNGGFEDENICTEFNMNCAPEGWMSNSFGGNYYFNDDANAWKGSHFVGMPFNSPGRTDARYFIRTRILCGLRKDAEYTLDFFIRSAQPDLDSIGIGFFADDPLYSKQTLKTMEPFSWMADLGPSFEKRGDRWYQVRLTYKAKGNENFLLIGDYKRKPHRFSGKPDLINNYYYFIDEIFLLPVNVHEKICASADSVKNEAYEVNERHSLLQKMAYVYSKNPPVIQAAPSTYLQKIDTLIIPDVLFATNSFRLNKEADMLLDSFIRNSGNRVIDSVVVEGHTDSTGSYSSNQVLSLNRAKSVAAFLQPRFSTVIRTAGWASDRPVADNRTTEGRRKNRRVEIYLYVRE